MENSDLLKVGLIMTKLTGLNEKRPTFLISGIYCWMNLISNIINFFLIVYGMYVYIDDFDFLPDALQSLITLLHTLNKTTAQMSYRKTLYDLIEKRERFWKIKDCKDIKEAEDALKIEKYTNFITKSYCASVCMSATSFVMRPILEKGTTSMRCYIPEGWYLFIAINQAYATIIIVLSSGGYDNVFLSICMELKIQFKLLCARIKNNTQNQDKNIYIKNWKEIAEHHSFLLTYCKDLNTMFARTILLQYICTALANSMEIYILLLSEAGIEKYFVQGSFCFVSFMELALYCFPAEYLSSEAARVNDEIYLTDWQIDFFPSARKIILMIIFRAQKTLIFHGYGFVVNSATYITIFKTTFSIYTFLESMVVDGDRI